MAPGSFTPRDTQKSLISAACRHYGVTVDFFNSGGKKNCPEKENDKRRIVHWLLWKDCGLNYSEVARIFGYTKQGMKEGIEKLDFMQDKRNLYGDIVRDIVRIREMAAEEAERLFLIACQFTDKALQAAFIVKGERWEHGNKTIDIELATGVRYDIEAKALCNDSGVLVAGVEYDAETDAYHKDGEPLVLLFNLDLKRSLITIPYILRPRGSEPANMVPEG